VGDSPAKATSIPAIPRTVWLLGFVSLFMDLSSELVHSLLPVFLVSTLGASVITVGLIEGVAEAATLIAKVFSGAISDYFRRRKGLILLGYGMAALTKPLFPLATSAEAVFSHASLIASEKASAVLRVMRWSQMSLPRRFAVLASVFVSRWTPLERFLGRYWQY
jgi:Na+/melibiose symporter-like transporter